MKHCRAIALLLGGALAAAAQAPELWREWLYSAPIAGQAAAEDQLLRAALPTHVNAHAQPGWRDLRIVSDTHEETPYLLRAPAAPEYVPLAVAFRLDGNAPRRQTWWIADLGAPQLVARLRFDLEEPDFYRAVRISRSDDGTKWFTVFNGEIFRLRRSPRASPREPRERLDFPLPEARARYWRVEVQDRDDPPLPGLRIALDFVPCYILFRAARGRSYRLFYGNRRATAPSYSLARLVDDTEIAAAAPASIGEEVPTPRTPPPQLPWTERNAIVLWIALAAATGLLGWLAIKALRG
jgi:hypothetical protein